MRLERVIAKDSRRATEQVIATYGPDALIISNQRVNGMTEIVVAIETEEAAKATSQPDTVEPLRTARPSRRTDAFGRTLLSSFEPERSTTKPEVAGTQSGEARTAGDAGTEPRHVPPFLRGAQAIADESTVQHHGDDARVEADTRIDESEPPKRSIRSAALAATQKVEPHLLQPTTPDVDKPTPSGRKALVDEAAELESQAIDSMRARELVDLVRAELASMRQEIALSRHVDVFPPGGALPSELQPLAGALASAGVPTALRMLLLDQARDCSDLETAVDSMKLHLAASMGSLDQSDRFEGIHVFAGPTGAGKTQMLFRLAARHIAQHGTGSVAVLSFADSRIGAWTQIQMLGARLGIDCFRVTGEELLGPMIEELQPKRLILIDTAGTGFAERLASIQRCAPKARLNLVVPADISASSLARFIPGTDVSWHSVMVSKLDEPTHLWPLIQGLCNHPVPISISSSSGATESTASAITPADLVRMAFDSLELPVKPTARARAPRKTASRSRREERHAA